MVEIPVDDDTPFIRTDFSDDAAWDALVRLARTPSPKGFLANLNIIDDRDFEGLSPQEIAATARGLDYAVLFIADRLTMTDPERPILSLDGFAPERVFRVTLGDLWGVENNLSLANMDFDEFSVALDERGIFRGF